MTVEPDDLAGWLARLSGGDRRALHAIIPLVYEDLKDLARRQLRRRGHATLETTGLVHEAYVRLAERSGLRFEDSRHFLGATATIMRHILVDHARRRLARKRGGGEHAGAGAETAADSEASAPLLREAGTLVAVDEALVRLERLNARLAAVVELRFFGGFSVEETAALLGVDGRTVKRDWQKARSHLARALNGEQP